ncbi:MAG TPA: hypothetical protein VG711_05905, partial [Phycisphaerales bacterium]|nr:hypothetical protein [Phycisphaerales bacterium]
MRISTSINRLSLLLLTLASLFACTDAAQAFRPAPPKHASPAAPPPATSPTVVQPEKSPLTINSQAMAFDSLGISINLPDFCSVTQEPTPDSNAITVAIRDSAKTPLWSMRIQSIPNARQNNTAKDQMERHLNELREGQQFQIIQNEPATYGGVASQLCYVRHTGVASESFISGWLIVPRKDTSFVVFTVATTPDVFPDIRKMLEASFSTLRLYTPNEISNERRERVEAGEAFLKNLHASDLKTLVGTKQVARSFVPSKTPGGKDTERAYSLIEVTEDSRKVFSDNADATTGLLFTIRGRAVQDAERKIYIDSLAQYWVAWDLSEEQWSVTVTRRQGQATMSQAETGVLPAATTGEPTPTLTIVISESAARTDEP